MITAWHSHSSVKDMCLLQSFCLHYTLRILPAHNSIIAWIPGLERELELPVCSVYSIPRLLIIRVYVCEPAYATVRCILEVRAFGVEKVEIRLQRNSEAVTGISSTRTHFLVWYVRNGGRTIRFHSWVRDGGPPVLALLSVYRASLSSEHTNLAQVQLLVLSVLMEPFEVRFHDRPR